PLNELDPARLPRGRHRAGRVNKQSVGAQNPSHVTTGVLGRSPIAGRTRYRHHARFPEWARPADLQVLAAARDHRLPNAGNGELLARGVKTGISHGSTPV